ncbi:hypothetical protein TRFO_35007 [Tritrichomonas foetus]|uniref:Trs120/TRAPPC9 first Ig-like domain-containing protein n=1 Tax=Tritrichomonas foetus TaxID=1144522 RepID=A0A1J4JM49_9EUKA|nr:hypothetical protein TRFO_35007 [Tritrichomonas foetus]|eukprot:OHS98605.1 hypothetical protein TRFO_35007 [Tritrichomonas foetus]
MIENLPIPFLSTESSVKVLLTAVGVKLPSAFKTLHSILDNLCKTLELDIKSFAPDFFNIGGQANFSLSVCESSDALPFLLGLADPLVPHLDFQVVVGAAVAESQQGLIECALSFDKIVQDSISTAVPCLFVFSSSSFDGSHLPACATQIPSDSSDVDVARRVREGFVRCSMEYLLDLRNKCDELYQGKDQPVNLAKLASYAFLLGGYDVASEFYNSALKHKPQMYVTSLVTELSSYSNLHIDFDKNSTTDRDVPSQLLPLLREDVSFPSEYTAAISVAHKCTDSLVEIRALIRIANKVPQLSRPLLQLAIQLMKGKHKAQYNFYFQLALLILLHNGYKRTFTFHCEQYLNSAVEVSPPSFLLKAFVDVITSSNDWCEQRVNPAARLFSSSTVPRAIKNNLMRYLLTYLHKITPSDKQNEILNLIPSNMEVDARILIDVRAVDYIPPNSPINEASSGRSNVFIYSPLTKRSSEKRCAAGDELSFMFQLYNPLAIPLIFDSISLNATNATVYPVVFTLQPKRVSNLALLLKAKDVGTLELSGFSFVSQNLTGIFRLGKPMVIDVIEKLPTLVMKQPFRFETKLVENSDININFQLINTSSANVDVKGIKFAPIPPVLTPTSLPIVYPPAVNPPLPPSLAPGQSHQFNLSFVADHSNTILSFAVEYGTDKFTRRFELNQQLEIVDGPHISHVQVVSLDDHDDFDTNTVTFMIVIKNPFSNPVVVRNTDNETPTVIGAKELGTFLLNVDRININIDPKTKKWISEGLDNEHIRKCESTAVKLKNAPLTIGEKRTLWSTLYLKKKIGEQLKFQWSTVNGLTGLLPFNHVNINMETLTLLQPPAFKVNFTLTKKMENVWELNTQIECEEPLMLRARLMFDLQDIGDNANCIFTAGVEENVVEAPTSFVTAIHCLPVGKLLVVGKFYIGDLDAFFVRRGCFPLQ